MIQYIITITVFVVWLGAVVFFAINAIDKESWIMGAIAAVIFILGLAFIMKGIADEEAEGPCLKQETSYAYNAATKTSAPYTHCVERGTWVK